MERIKAAIAQARLEQQNSTVLLRPDGAGPERRRLRPDGAWSERRRLRPDGAGPERRRLRPVEPPRGRNGMAVAVALGLAGLIAGGAALWLTLAQQAVPERAYVPAPEQSAPLAIEQSASAKASDTGDVDNWRRGLAARLDLIDERIAALEERLDDNASRGMSTAGIDERPAGAAAEIEGPRIAAVAGPAPPEPVAATVVPTAAPPDDRAAATAPRQADPEPHGKSPPADVPAPPAAAPGSAAAEAQPAQAAALLPPSTAVGGVGDALPAPEGGDWAVVLQSFARESTAARRLAEAQASGVPAEVRLAWVKGRVWYRVIVPGYSSQQSARAAAAELGRRKLGTPWLLRLGSSD